MVPEMTPAERRAQRELVFRSWLLAESRAERSEDGLMGHVEWPRVPVPPPRPCWTHEYVFPVTREL